MQIEGYDCEVSAYISNDYLGMSQRPETKEAGINAVLKYGTGASAAQAIGGFDIGYTVSAIFPIMVRDNRKVYEIARELQKRCIFVNGITYPAVRTKEARLRISVLASHEIVQLEQLVTALVEIRKSIPF